MAEPAPVVFKMLPVDLIDPPDNPLRSQADEQRFEELVTSVRKFGVIEPIGVKVKGARYQVVYGHLRLLAARAAGLLEVPAVIRSESGGDEALLMLEENLARQEINPMEEARLYNRLIYSYGYSVETIAERRGVSPQTIYNKLALLRAPEDVQQALERGEITYSHAVAIAKLPDKAKREYYIHQVRDYGASAATLRSWVDRELIQAGVKAKPEPPPPVSQPSEKFALSGVQCVFCDEVHDPLETVQLFLCLRDWDLFRRFKQSYFEEELKREPVQQRSVSGATSST